LLLNVHRQARQGEVFTISEWESFAETYCGSLADDLGIDASTLLNEILSKLDRPGKAYLQE
jgi:hypothetical protein